MTSPVCWSSSSLADRCPSGTRARCARWVGNAWSVGGDHVELSWRLRRQSLTAPLRVLGLTGGVSWRVHSHAVMSDLPPTEQRLARIERTLTELSAEVAAIRAELRLPDSKPSARSGVLVGDGGGDGSVGRA